MTDAEVYAATLKNGGLTLDLHTGKQPTKGFVVSIYPELEKMIPYHEFTIKDLEEYRNTNAGLLYGLPTGCCLGTWIANDIIYLDVVVVERTKKVAIACARLNGQLAIYDLAKGVETFISAERAE